VPRATLAHVLPRARIPGREAGLELAPIVLPLTGSVGAI
jgi:hypothetical protein